VFAGIAPRAWDGGEDIARLRVPESMDRFDRIHGCKRTDIHFDFTTSAQKAENCFSDSSPESFLERQRIHLQLQRVPSALGTFVGVIRFVIDNYELAACVKPQIDLTPKDKSSGLEYKIPFVFYRGSSRELAGNRHFGEPCHELSGSIARFWNFFSCQQCMDLNADLTGCD
jgi:hypothetical protein